MALAFITKVYLFVAGMPSRPSPSPRLDYSDMTDGRAQNHDADESPRVSFMFFTSGKTCPCNIFPHMRHFYVVKLLGYAGLCNFSYSLIKNKDCGYLFRWGSF